MHNKPVRLRSRRTRMPRTLLRRTPPNPLSLRLLLSLVKSQPASLAAGTGALFNLLFTIPYCRGAPNTSTAMRPLDCLHRTIRSSISFRFRLYFQIVWSTVRMVLLFFFFFLIFRSWFTAYGVQSCHSIETARVFLRIFSLMSLRFKIPRQLLSGNSLLFVYWLQFRRIHIDRIMNFTTIFPHIILFHRSQTMIMNE